MNINKFSVRTLNKYLLFLGFILIGMCGAISPLFYLLVPILCLAMMIRRINLKEIMNILFWIIVVTLFLGAYLSVPGYESIYLFRCLIPVHLILLVLTRDIKWGKLQNYLIYLILLFFCLISSVISLLWAGSTSLGFRYCYFIFEICYLFFICFYHLDSKEKMRRLFQVITVIFSISLVLGVVEIFTGWHLPFSSSLVYVTTTSEFQPTGFLYNTNDYALMMAILYPIAASCVFQFKRRYTGIVLYGVLTILTLYVVISTYSRIGMLSIGISTLVIFFYRFKQKGVLLLVSLFPLLGIFVWFSSFGQKLIEIAYAAFNDKGTSTMARNNLYKLLLQIIHDSDFMGVGAGNVPQKLNALLIGYTDTGTDAYTTGHNFWLETIGNIGLIGFLGFAAIIIIYLIQLFQSGYLKKSPTPLLIWITFIGASIALSTILEKRFLWFLLATGICLIQQMREGGRET
ncbi:O-antigen ligase family protein [Listeria weihenstephanensis]|uniref:O-antigen ligase family protein n=1 Tax=Listeria weihenstephanensis TaxID=1006155 RepID=A0A841Z9J8_9LIST|nr:O-antigen ligase family protein [Listeria weihenstephanensis]MBC1501870.1 O-antigen ligase family protein [Listeria weihenstephanensis]